MNQKINFTYFSTSQQPTPVNLPDGSSATLAPSDSLPLASYNYNDVTIFTADGVIQPLNIPQVIPLFLIYPQLRHACHMAINQAVRELIDGITERAINVALNITENICKKDFCMDP